MLNSTNLLFLSIEYVRGKTWTGITVLVTITSSVCHSTNNFLGAAEIKKTLNPGMSRAWRIEPKNNVEWFKTSHEPTPNNDQDVPGV